MKFVAMNIFLVLLSFSLFGFTVPFSSRFQQMLEHEENQKTKSIFDLDSRLNSNNQLKSSLFDNKNLELKDIKDSKNEKPKASLFHILNEKESTEEPNKDPMPHKIRGVFALNHSTKETEIELLAKKFKGTEAINDKINVELGNDVIAPAQESFSAVKPISPKSIFNQEKERETSTKLNNIPEIKPINIYSNKDLNSASNGDFNLDENADKPVYKQKKLNSLRNRIKNLELKNKELLKELKLIDKAKPTKDSDIEANVNFIQKFQSNLNKIESDIISKNYLMKNNEDFSALMQIHEAEKTNAFDKLNQLEKESKNLISSLKLISEKELVYKEKLTNTFEVDELQINKDLDIKGLLIAKKTNLKKIKIKKEKKEIDIDANSLDLKDSNLNLIAEKKSISLENMLNKVKFLQKIKELCNENNKYCLVPQEDKKKYNSRQQEILENMRLLKNETAVVLEKVKNIKK